MLHTPEGFRDIYNGECRLKQSLENSLLQVFHLYGFEDIETPSFEFFEVFNQERGTISSRKMYKLFDREGNTLVLRPDITPSVARCAAKYFKEVSLPLRLCYRGNTFINQESHMGRLNEVTQLGVELLNDGSPEADAEIVALTVEALKAAGLTQLQVEIGHADFLNGILEEGRFSQEEQNELKTLLESKNRFGIEAFLEEKSFSPQLKRLLALLPELFGGLEALKKIEEEVKNERSQKALERLKRLYQILSFYGLESYITFDLGMLSRYDYYTGLLLKAYTYGSGEPIAKGGRYDSLVGQFGKPAPAIGVAIVADQLLLALERQKKAPEQESSAIALLYPAEKGAQAVAMATSLRREGKRVCLCCFSEAKKEELCLAYQEKKGIEKLIIL